jgi:flagellar biosynthesis/type III secretory pathway protein FliH
VVADSSLEPGDLVIQSNLGQLDARIKQQLVLMLKSLREEAVG